MTDQSNVAMNVRDPPGQLNGAQIAMVERRVAEASAKIATSMQLRKWAMELVLNTQAEIKQAPDVKACLELAAAVYGFVAGDIK